MQGTDLKDAADIIRFNPPLYIQRYNKVLEILSTLKPEKVVDFGCAECKFINLLRREEYVIEICGVDLDGNLLSESSFKLEPLASDFLYLRHNPLTIRLYQGSVSEFDTRLRNFDAVVCIELIEHLLPKTLKDFPKTVFSCIQPKHVIISTPNSDFNVHFNLNGSFRHWDHKFEWTREQFKSWCEGICTKYHYSVVFDGVGTAPENRPSFGHCSQFAIFTKLESDRFSDEQKGGAEILNLVAEMVFPFQAKGEQVKKKLIGDVLRCVGEIVAACVLAMKPKVLVECEEEDKFLCRKNEYAQSGWDQTSNNFNQNFTEVEIGQFSDAESSEECINESKTNLYNIPAMPVAVMPYNKSLDYFNRLSMWARRDHTINPKQFESVEDDTEKEEDFSHFNVTPGHPLKLGSHLPYTFQFYDGNLHNFQTKHKEDVIYGNETFTRIPLTCLCKHYLLKHLNDIVIQSTSLDDLNYPHENYQDGNLNDINTFNEKNWDSE
uniref:small RNA 2'-O-methyltransferase-like isoform X2 n=1 Tax=Ciona intestinalis TaxID=7719 RepID=UPI0005217D0C|nr:small RNA 2'-O-methyltransferase-like isoform X2 [Ciona intestinalis]|eukprot:XP_009857739.1 small RNA 2'-O-methyltransferase-like isoform X2 [Ciona intestinalis]